MYPLYKVLAFQQTFVCVSCKCVYAREYMRASVCARVRAGTCVCACASAETEYSLFTHSLQIC